MAIDLTTIFGSNITVLAQPRSAKRQYARYPGAGGMTAMHLGTIGRRITVTGLLAAGGADYNAARANLQVVINTIQGYLAPTIGPADYHYRGDIYYAAVFDEFRITGKILWTASGAVKCRFTAILQELV